MGVATGMSLLKFVSFAFYGLILITVLAGVINGVMEWRKTGDNKVLVESTLGEVVNWDGKIYVAMNQLTDEEFMNQIPAELRKEYASTIAKGVLIHLFLFVVLGFLMFKIGNWLAGYGQFSPMTDVAIVIVAAFMIFVVIPLVYGYYTGTEVTLFKGMYLWLTNFGTWWNAMMGAVI